jgi:hypothetical protein
MRRLAELSIIRALVICCVAAVLNGCGEPLSSANGQALPVVTRSLTSQSWALPEASGIPSLLYVSNPSNVAIYTYENAQDIKLVGELTGFRTLGGLCADRNGRVFIVDSSARKVYEYAHGGTEPLRTYSRVNGYPYSCAVDRNTNNLAISIEHPNGKFQEFANVIVYANEVGAPKTYTLYSGFYQTYFLAYDNKSNLYVDASPCVPYCYEGGGPPALFALPAGGSLFQQVPLSGVNLYAPTGLVWVNPSLLIADNNLDGNGTTGAYKVIVTPTSGSLKGTLDFAGTEKTYGLAVRGEEVLVPDQGADIFRIYSLSSGTLDASFTNGITTPFAAVVSQKE